MITPHSLFSMQLVELFSFIGAIIAVTWAVARVITGQRTMKLMISQQATTNQQFERKLKQDWILSERRTNLRLREIDLQIRELTREMKTKVNHSELDSLKNDMQDNFQTLDQKIGLIYTHLINNKNH